MEHTINDLFDLEGKIAIISGGAGHLGTQMSFALAELGANVIIASRDKSKCEKLAQKICNHFNDDSRAVAKSLDVTDMSSIEELFDFVNENYNGLDILINNAWSGKKNSFESIDKKDWYYDIDISLNSVFKMVKVFFPLLKLSEGIILNTASMYGHVAPDYHIYEGTEYTNPPSYGAAKAGVIQLTKYLASFLSPYNIRVNAISPGPFPFGKTLNDKDFIKRLSEKNPLNRIGKAYEVKGVVALLCSEASSYMTGQNICVDGGWTIW